MEDNAPKEGKKQPEGCQKRAKRKPKGVKEEPREANGKQSGAQSEPKGGPRREKGIKIVRALYPYWCIFEAGDV